MKSFLLSLALALSFIASLDAPLAAQSWPRWSLQLDGDTLTMHALDATGIVRVKNIADSTILEIDAVTHAVRFGTNVDTFIGEGDSIQVGCDVLPTDVVALSYSNNEPFTIQPDMQQLQWTVWNEGTLTIYGVAGKRVSFRVLRGLIYMEPPS